MDADEARATIHSAVEDTTSYGDDLPEGSFCVGWVVVAEWVAPSGQRWLAKIDGNATGDPCTDWQVQGYLWNAMYGQKGWWAQNDDR